MNDDEAAAPTTIDGVRPQIVSVLLMLGDPWFDEKLVTMSLKAALAAFAYRRGLTPREAYDAFRDSVTTDEEWNEIKPLVEKRQLQRRYLAAVTT